MIEIDLDKISKNELATILIEKDKEIKRLHSIIKEVREYIDYFLKEGHTKNWKQFEYSLLEILDKEKIIYGDNLKVEWYGEGILDRGE